VSQDAYTRAGVSQSRADAAVEALVASLTRSGGGRGRTVPLPGHYASVIRLDDRIGIALTTDGVGTKLLVAERLGRWDTVGIDCVAMNVNDLICVGAQPLAMVDYVAVPSADPDVCAELGKGLGRGAELAGIDIPGGELAQLGELVAGVDLSGAAVGVVELEAIVDGAVVEPGDPIVGLPSSGLHSNGSLAVP
jgi:phosphoribosylformylglycinamidine cyclo-ligase